MSRSTRTLARLGGVTLAAVTVAGAVTSCTSKDTAGQRVAVSSLDSGCEVDATQFEAGTITVEVTNKGDQVTEIYVYAEGDEIKGEVENVGPGTTRDFTVDLSPGQYEIVCKPGMTGDGIRQTITVAGTPTTEAAPDRTISFGAQDYEYMGIDGLTVDQGERVEFLMTNDATDEQHEFEVSGPDGTVEGEIGPTDPGATGRLVLTFDKPGTYTYVCGISDHEDKGMKGTFTVVAT